jgi:hypothetical protein
MVRLVDGRTVACELGGRRRGQYAASETCSTRNAGLLPRCTSVGLLGAKARKSR